MSNQENIKVTPIRLLMIAVLLSTTVAVAFSMLNSYIPLGTTVQAVSQKIEAMSADPAIPRTLPSDLCVISDKPLMPELDYIGYGSPPGLVLKYVNQEGDLVLMVEGEILGVFEGDFCHE